MYSFIDLNGFKVELSFERGVLQIEPRHVLVLVLHDSKWLCTIHEKRGVEFPGGKMEDGETLEQAAIREVYEETGVVIKDIQYFAEYAVYDEPVFCKAVFVASFVRQDDIAFDLETTGMLWIPIEQFFERQDLSFHMKDGCLQHVVQEVLHRDVKW